MKATELRLGNILSTVDDPGHRGAVLTLEPGLVHLVHREYADDENLLLGVPVTRSLLDQYHIPYGTWHQFGRERVYIDLPPNEEYAFLHAPGVVMRFEHLHELQNIMLEVCNHELITDPVVHHPFHGCHTPAGIGSGAIGSMEGAVEPDAGPTAAGPLSDL